MRFNTNITSSLSSLPERIEHGNVAAAAGIDMSAKTYRTNRNMSDNAVSANLADTVSIGMLRAVRVVLADMEMPSAAATLPWSIL